MLNSSSASRACPSQWQKHSLEGGSSGGGADCAAPCVASFLLPTTGAVGLWELPGLSLQRDDNMQDHPWSLLGPLSERGEWQKGTTAFTHT